MSSIPVQKNKNGLEVKGFYAQLVVSLRASALKKILSLGLKIRAFSRNSRKTFPLSACITAQEKIPENQCVGTNHSQRLDSRLWF
jgi:hypothetical protein